VQITIDDAPAGTEVLLDNHKLGATPDPIALPRDSKEIELAFRHPGYVSTTRKLVPDHDQKVSVALPRAKTRQPATTPPIGSGHDPHSIEDPFHH